MIVSKVTILQLNTEGLTRAKRDLIRHIADKYSANVLLIQETHICDDAELNIEGFSLTDHVPNKHHGLATYARDGVDPAPTNKSPNESSIEWITTKVGSYYFTNVYETPGSSIDNRTLPTTSLPSIVCGDFNSRCTSWGYSDTNVGGSTLVAWAEIQDLYVLYDVKDHATFYSERRKKWFQLGPLLHLVRHRPSLSTVCTQ